MQKKVWTLQLVRYLVSFGKYTRVNFFNVAEGPEDEDVWLTNPDHPVYPIIRITNSDNDFLGKMDYVDEEFKMLRRNVGDKGKALDIEFVQKQYFETGEEVDHLYLYPGCSLPETIKKLFPSMNNVIFDVNDPEKEAKVLEASIDGYALRNRRNERGKAKANIKELPSLTKVLAVVCGVIWVAVNLMALYFESDTITTSIVLGAYYKAFVVILNQWWRLLTAGFVHIDFFHLLCNMIALNTLAKFMEKAYGKLKSWIVLIVAIIVGNLCVFAADVNTVAVGLSGGIYGFFGVMTVYYVKQGLFKDRMARNGFLQTMFINVLISMMPNVSFLAHLGGYVAGLFMAVVIDGSQEKALRINFAICAVLSMLGLSYFAYSNRGFTDIYYGTDLNVAEVVGKMGFTKAAGEIRFKTYNYYEGVNWYE